MSNQSCFGEHWKIIKFKSLERKCGTDNRPAEILYVGDSTGSVKVNMSLELIQRDNADEGYVLDISVMMKFHGILVTRDIKVDFFVVCGDVHHDMDSTVITHPSVGINYLSRSYKCYKQNLGIDSSLTPNKTLTLAPRYSISTSIDIVEVPIQKSSHVDIPINDIERLLDDDEFADFVFSVQGVDFKVHKAIIAVRSSVFQAMVHHNMKEKAGNRAEITDVYPEVFKEMLRYVYTGKVENLPTVVEELIKVADKYGLRGLKDICEDELSEGLCPDNAIELLNQADVLNCDRLKAQTIEYIVKNISRVSDTDAWKNLASNLSAKLIAEICFRWSKGKGLRCEEFQWTNWENSSSSLDDSSSDTY